MLHAECQCAHPFNAGNLHACIHSNKNTPVPVHVVGRIGVMCVHMKESPPKTMRIQLTARTVRPSDLQLLHLRWLVTLENMEQAPQSPFSQKAPWAYATELFYIKKIVVCEFSPQRQLSVEASKGQQLTAAVKLYGIGSWTMPELGRAAREAMKAAFSVLDML